MFNFLKMVLYIENSCELKNIYYQINKICPKIKIEIIVVPYTILIQKTNILIQKPVGLLTVNIFLAQGELK